MLPQHPVVLAEKTAALYYLNAIFTTLLRMEMSEPDILKTLMLEQRPAASVNERQPIAELVNCWHRAIEASQEPLLPLRAGEHVHPNDFGTLGSLIMNCESIEDAFRLAHKYQAVVADGLLQTLIHDGDHVLNRLDTEGCDPNWLAPFVEFVFCSTIQLGHITTANLAKDINVTVHFMHKPAGPIAEYKRIFNAEVLFEQPHNQFVIPRQSLQRALYSPDMDTRQVLLQKVSQQFESLSGNANFKSQLRCYLHQQVTDKLPSLEASASHFHMSPSTLKRKLAQEDSSFQQLRDEVLSSVARQLLADPKVQINDIAATLNFSGSTSFINAFKRWTGLTPTQFRRNSLSDQQD